MKKVKSSIAGSILKSKIIIAFLSIILLATLSLATYNWVGNDLTYNATEGIAYHHNLTNNITCSVDGNSFCNSTDNLTFYIDYANSTILWNGNAISYDQISNWIYISDATTGDLVINATRDNETGSFRLPLKISWSSTYSSTFPFYFNITPVNDAPSFVGLQNFSMNANQLFYQTIGISDEENDYPFKLNTTFLSCALVDWSTRNCSTELGRALFNTSNISQYSFDNITGQLILNFIPSRNDIGNYTLNFTVEDTANLSVPYLDPSNKSTTQIVNFTVKDTNIAPQFTSVCNSTPGNVYQNITEDQPFLCYINVTDLGETNSITFNFTTISTFSSSLSWFSNLTVNNSLSNYNASMLINITPNFRNVGNWTINISAKDAGTTWNNGVQSNLTNYTTLTFFVNFVNHSVILDSLSNLTLSNSLNAPVSTSYVNASDNDLLILDKTTYNESLTFNLTLNGTTRNWANITTYSIPTGTNVTTARIIIDPRNQTGGNYSANVSVYDSNRNSTSYKTFNLELKSNDAPTWSLPAQTNLGYDEGNRVSLNLSQNVSDPNGDALTFSYTNDTIFPSFNLNSTTGIINFTTTELDVGQHIINISATDPLQESNSVLINITIYNVNEAPRIEIPITSANLQGNATYNSTINTIVVYEKQLANITIFAQDSDFLILQKSFGNESLNLTLSCNPSCPSWLNFTNRGTLGNRTNFTASFTPPKNSTTYNLTILIRDNGSLTDTLNFNLTLIPINNAPTINSFSSPFKKAINESFYFDFNATDEEDGNDSSGNLTWSLTNLTTGGNFLTINSTSGIVNKTNLTNISGVWRYNLTVTDSGGKISNYSLFDLYIYSNPRIVYPTPSQNITLAENSTAQITFGVNDSVGYWLNGVGGLENDFYISYSVYINDILRNTTSTFGNGTNISLTFPLNFTDHICSTQETVRLNVTNNMSLSNSSTWNLTINNTEYPLEALQNFSDVSTTGTSTTFDLTSYFKDYDAQDICYNQTIGFTYTLVSGSGQTVSITNWTNGTNPSIVFSSSSESTASYSITAIEYNISNSSQAIRNITTNNFMIHLIPTTITTTTETPSGGGGGTVTKVVFLKIIVPEPITARNKDTIVIPIRINNPSESTLSGITLTANISKNGIPRNDFSAIFSKDKFEAISPGNTELTDLTLRIDNAENGDYEINIAANVTNPKYSDWAKIYLTVNEGKATFEKIVFTEKLIVDNPECLEMKELLDEAKKEYDLGNYDAAQQQTEKAIEACKKSIEQRSSSLLPKKYLSLNTIYYVIIASIIAFIIGIAIYYYQRLKIEKTGV